MPTTSALPTALLGGLLGGLFLSFLGRRVQTMLRRRRRTYQMVRTERDLTLLSVSFLPCRPRHMARTKTPMSRFIATRRPDGTLALWFHHAPVSTSTSRSSSFFSVLLRHATAAKQTEQIGGDGDAPLMEKDDAIRPDDTP